MDMPEYDNWLKDPTPENLGKVVDTLSPTLISEVQRFSGPKPLLRAKAKELAIKAIHTYDPTKGAALKSWAVTQLQPLHRYGKQLRPVRSSELAIQQAAEINTQTQRLQEELGRDPEDHEIADYVGISVKRIRDLRRKVVPTMNESSLASEDTGQIDLPAVTGAPGQNDYASEAAYMSLSPRERKIFDWKTGLHGQSMLTNQEIARRLGLTPAAISQISGNMALRIKDISNALR